MSISTLESLPNEILLKLFERYINGIDILNAFLHQLNQRFDDLIRQSKRFSFNFIDCQKQQYLSCLAHFRSNQIFLPEKIEELILSEENTTGQIKTFLTFFRTFNYFPCLRKLYVHLNEQFEHAEEIIHVIRYLQIGSIEILSIRITNTLHESLLLAIDSPIIGFDHLKRLFLYDEINLNQWFHRGKQYSQLQYLTYSGSSCEWGHLPIIFHCCPQLRYLNIEFADQSLDFIRQSPNQSSTPIVSIPNLQTLILSFKPTDTTEFTMLANYLMLMPNLHRLQIKAHEKLLNANEWEDLIQRSLSHLSHFRLRTTTLHIRKDTHDNLLNSFETLFWRTMEDFYFIITEHKHFDSNRCSSDDIYSQSIISWWIVPFRRLIDDKPTDNIHSFTVCGTANYLTDYYMFSKIKYLIILNLDESFLPWLRRCMNFFSIEYLDFSYLRNDLNSIRELLSFLPNLKTLKISSKHLNLYQSSQIKSLHLTDIEFRFEIEHLRLISQQYPELEHLTLQMVQAVLNPEWRIHLPYLRSLTYLSKDGQWLQHSIDYRNPLSNTFALRNQLTSQRFHPWKTIWIDEKTLLTSH